MQLSLFANLLRFNTGNTAVEEPPTMQELVPPVNQTLQHIELPKTPITFDAAQIDELPVYICNTQGRRRAVARPECSELTQYELGIVVYIPKHWPKSQKPQIIDQLTDLAREYLHKQWGIIQDFLTQQVARGISPNLITVENKAELLHLTNRINQQTLQLEPLSKVRIGSSTHSRLAQMNIRLRQMTISCHAIKDVPMRALRYLILHELSHLVHADHSSDFWELVETYEPEYKYYDKLIKAFHELKSLGINF